MLKSLNKATLLNDMMSSIYVYICCECISPTVHTTEYEQDSITSNTANTNHVGAEIKKGVEYDKIFYCKIRILFCKPFILFAVQLITEFIN